MAGVNESGNDVEDRGLAASAATDEHQQLPGLHIYRDPVQGTVCLVLPLTHELDLDVDE